MSCANTATNDSANVSMIIVYKYLDHHLRNPSQFKQFKSNNSNKI